MAKKTKAQVQFEADVSGFNEGIKSADQSLTTFRKELKLNSAELKEDSDNVDLLTKRKEILQQELDVSASKVELLNNKLNSAKSIFGEDSKEVYQLTNKLIDAKTQFQGIANEIQQTDSKITNFASSSKNVTKSLDDVEDSLKNANEGFTVFKGVLANVIGNGISAGFSSLKDCIVDSTSAMSKFKAQTGLTEQEAKKLEKVINELYSDGTGESISDIADAMAEVKAQTKEVDPSKLKDLTQNAISLRDTFDFDIQESIRAVNMLTAQFGITGEEAFNLIVQGAQNGLNKNGDLLDSINEYSVHYKTLGFTSEQFFNSLINGSSAGTFSVDKLGDAMKEFSIRSRDTAASTDEGFKLLGLNADKMRQKFSQGGEVAQKAFNETWVALMSLDDQVKQNQAGVDLFGTMWEDLGIDGVSALSDVSAWTENTNVTIDKTKNSMQQLSEVRYSDTTSQLNQLGRTLKEGIVTPIVEKLLPALNSGLTWVKDNLNILVPIVGTLGGMFASYFAVTKILGLIGKIKTLVTIVKIGIPIFKALNVVMRLNPIGIIITLVAGLVMGFVTLWNKCEGFRNFFIGLGNGIKNTFKAACDGIKNAFSSVVNWFKTSINNTIGFFKLLGSGVKAVFDAIKNVVVFGLKAIGSIFMAQFQIITLPFTFIWENVKGIVIGAFNSVKEFISGVLNEIGNKISSAFNFVSNLLSPILDGIKTKITDSWNNAKETVSNIVTGISTKISSVFNSIKTNVSNIVNGIKEKISGPIQAAKETVSFVIDGIKDKTVNTFNNMKTSVGNTFNKIKEAITKPIENAKNLIGQMVDKIKSFFSKLSLKLPKIKLPHFKLSGKLSLSPPSVPKMKIDWYAKGAIFTKPTIFATPNGYKGVGEAGPEGILPISRLEGFISNSMRRNSISNYDPRIGRLIEIAEQLLMKDNNLYVNGRKLSEEIVSSNDEVTGEYLMFKERGLVL